MKYDRRAIMKNAWTIRRESGCTMAAALKKAWTVAKEEKMKEIQLAEMTGSEKQVAWATDIIRWPYRQMMLLADHYEKFARVEHAEVCRKAAETYRDTYEKATVSNPNMTSAAWIIDKQHIFKGAMEQAIRMATNGTSCKPYEFKINY